MSSESQQSGFSFDSVLQHIPEPIIRARPQPPAVLLALLELNGPALIERVRQAAREFQEDDIAYDAALLAVGFTPESLTAYHRARMLDALLGPDGEWQGYPVPPGGIRFRRRPPLEACPGFESRSCGTPVPGGGFCRACRTLEEEDLYNQP